VVIGVGNEFRRDDGAGPAVIGALRDRVSSGVELVITDGEPTRLIEAWTGVALAVVVDAVRAEPPQPGTTHRFVVDRPGADAARPASSHGFGLDDAIALALALDRMPGRLIVHAIEAADLRAGWTSCWRRSSLPIVDPRAVAERYVAPLTKLRRRKGWTEEVARERLADPITVGTMMLRQGEVDGLVCGAAHTTAATVRPALQILGTKPGSRLVSSVSFMCLPDQVVIYGDCAINPQPGAEDLADIAIQSAASARAFGIEPRVAMISFSTGGSGTGTDVEKSPKPPASCANVNPAWPSTAPCSTTRPPSPRSVRPNGPAAR
jgi:hydrogenase maturation protease